jgi:hypothetical protein
LPVVPLLGEPDPRFAPQRHEDILLLPFGGSITVRLKAESRSSRHPASMTEQFAPAIREEIVDKIGPLWDVKKLDVLFTD